MIVSCTVSSVSTKSSPQKLHTSVYTPDSHPNKKNRQCVSKWHLLMLTDECRGWMAKHASMLEAHLLKLYSLILLVLCSHIPCLRCNLKIYGQRSELPYCSRQAPIPVQGPTAQFWQFCGFEVLRATVHRAKFLRSELKVCQLNSHT